MWPLGISRLDVSFENKLGRVLSVWNDSGNLMLAVGRRNTYAKTTCYKRTMNPRGEDSSEMKLDTKVSMVVTTSQKVWTNLDCVVYPSFYYISSIYQSLDRGCVDVRPIYIFMYTQVRKRLQRNLHSRKVKNDGVKNWLLHVTILFCLASTLSRACVIPWPVSSFDVGHVSASFHVCFDVIN